MIHKIQDTAHLASLFDAWQETMIFSCLQNVMGSIYSDDNYPSKSAMADLGDFCFFAGTPDASLISYKINIQNPEFCIMVPQNADWASLIEETCAGHCKKVTRLL